MSLVYLSRLEKLKHHLEGQGSHHNLPADAQVTLYQELISLLKILQRGPEVISYSVKLADYLMQIKRYQEAKALFKDLLSSKNFFSLTKASLPSFPLGVLYQNLIKCLEEEGEIEEATTYKKLCLDYYHQRKNAPKGIFLIENHEKQYGPEISLIVYKLKFLHLISHQSEIKKSLLTLFNILDSSIHRMTGAKLKTLFNELAFLFPLENLENREGQDNFVLPEVYELLVRSYFFKVNEAAFVYSKKEEGAFCLGNILLEGIRRHPLYLPFYYWMAKLFLIENKLESGMRVLEFLEIQKSNPEAIGLERMKEILPKLKKEVMEKAKQNTWPKDEPNEDHPGLPLLKAPWATLNIPKSHRGANSQVLNQRSRRLEHDIEFLMKKNLPHKAKEKLKELEKLRPYSAFVHFYHWKINKNERGEGKEGKESDLGVASSLEQVKMGPTIEEIFKKAHQQSPPLKVKHEKQEEQEEQFEEFIQKCEKAYLQLIKQHSKDFLLKNFQDLVIAFNGLGLYQVSHKLLDNVEKEGEFQDDLDKLSLFYLRIETFCDQGNYFEALALAERINRQFPLNREESLCFLYLEAEILQFLCKNEKALHIYKIISQIDCNYRLVNEKIKILKGN